MARWFDEVDLRGTWKRGGVEWKETRDEVVKIMRGSNWMGWTTSDLADELDAMLCAQTVDEFNMAWDAMYNIADAERVWIRIF